MIIATQTDIKAEIEVWKQLVDDEEGIISLNREGHFGNFQSKFFTEWKTFIQEWY